MAHREGSPRGLALIVAVLASAGCGASREATPSGVPMLEEGVVLATGSGLRFEALSEDGTLVAYSASGESERRLLVVATSGEEATIDLGGFAEIDSARFDRTTLLVFEGDGVADGFGGADGGCTGKSCGPPPSTWAARLHGWRPGDTSLTALATDVDPGSVRFSKNGRFASLEANDGLGVGATTPDILLLDTTDLSVRQVARANLARARFANGSDWLVFGGVGLLEPAPEIAEQVSGDCATHSVARLSLEDGIAQRVTCYDSAARSRWELTRHDDALIHSVIIDDVDWLARTPIEGGEPELLAGGLAGASRGKSFDVSPGKQESVAFLRNDPAVGNELAVRSLEDDSLVVLSAEPCVEGIVANDGYTIVYNDCVGLRVVTLADGSIENLGGYEARLVDTVGLSLLALSEGTVQLLPAPGERSIAMGTGFNDARLFGEGRVLASRGSETATEWSLHVLDLFAGLETEVLRTTGPFGLHPSLPASIVVTTEVDGVSQLVRTAFVEED